jgi:hypothetical protein
MSVHQSAVDGKIRVGTTAIHKMGDISRSEEFPWRDRLVFVRSESEDDYVGNWVEGFGFVGVFFPKETTRPLTADEVESLRGFDLRLV